MVCLPLIVTLELKSPLHKGGKNSPKLANKEEGNQSDKPYHARGMSWAQRLRRVFNIDNALIAYVISWVLFKQFNFSRFCWNYWFEQGYD